MPKDPEGKYTAVNITREAKKDLDKLQVYLSAQVGRRLSYAEAIIVATRLLTTPDESVPDLHVVR
jgi:hypothetical protein